MNRINSINNQFDDNHDWRLIFSFQEFITSLTKGEQVQLSSLSKHLNKKLKPYTFDHLDLGWYQPDYRQYDYEYPNLTNSEIINYQIEKLTHDLKPYGSYVISLIIGKYFNHGLILTIPTILPNLSALELNYTKIPLENLNELFDQLPTLKSLTLSRFTVIVCSEHTEPNIYLNFPKCLNNLTFNNCRLHKTEFDSDPLSLYQDLYDCNLNQFEYLNFSHSYLLNLKSIKFLSSQHAWIPILNELLSQNLQISSYEIPLGLLNEQGLNLLQQCNQLTTLKFVKVCRPHFELTDFNIPKLITLKYLEWDEIFQSAIPFIHEFCLACPNLTHLTIEYNDKLLEWLDTILSNLNQLDTLIIHNKTSFEDFGYEFQPCELKHLVFEGFDPLKIDFNMFKWCSKLQKVTVGYSPLHSSRWGELQPHYDTISGWTGFVHDEIIQCYKD